MGTKRPPLCTIAAVIFFLLPFNLLVTLRKLDTFGNHHRFIVTWNMLDQLIQSRRQSFSVSFSFCCYNRCCKGASCSGTSYNTGSPLSACHLLQNVTSLKTVIFLYLFWTPTCHTWRANLSISLVLYPFDV